MNGTRNYGNPLAKILARTVEELNQVCKVMAWVSWLELVGKAFDQAGGSLNKPRVVRTPYWSARVQGVGSCFCRPKSLFISPYTNRGQGTLYRTPLRLSSNKDSRLHE